MPLIDISGEDAVSIRKQNPYAGWGNRTQVNRVEPIAKPNFSIPFRIEKGEKIFTVGSCFARNVEVELLRRGFRLPMRELFSRPEFAGLEPGVVNNFGTPSIYNEFAWAFGEHPFVMDDHIVEVQADKYVDLHVISSVRPEKREAVVARRQGIMEGYRAALDCRIVIMTLGLVEVWFDTQTGYYLNAAPLPGMLRREPQRFRLHVLSYDETLAFLEKAIELLQRKGRSDLQVLLTVSPVPLAATHRPDDVMVANTYSKSVLRTVAETVSTKYDFVSYYPSYESIILSDRKAAWLDDFTHVTSEIVAVNVGRMVDACVARDSTESELADTFEIGGLELVIEKARKMRSGSTEEAAAFFQQFARYATESMDFALEYAQFLAANKHYQAALDCLQNAPGGLDEPKATQLAAESFLKLRQGKEAYALLDKALAGGVKANSLWRLLLNAATMLNDEALVLGVLGRWMRSAPGQAGRANALVGRWFHETGALERALGYFQIASARNATDALAQIYHVETLMALARVDEAKALFATIEPIHRSETILHGRLAKVLGVEA